MHRIQLSDIDYIFLNVGKLNNLRDPIKYRDTTLIIGKYLI